LALALALPDLRWWPIEANSVINATRANITDEAWAVVFANVLAGPQE